MFNNIVIKLKAINSGKLRVYPGQKIHAMFLKIVNEVSESESELLHKQDDIKGFTVSSILGLSGENGYDIEKNCYYYIKISTFYDKLFKIFSMAAFKKKILNQILNLEDINFKIINVYFDKRQSKWAGVFNLEKIMEKDCLNDEVCLKFHTPTLFKTGDSFLTRPDNEKVFNSLLRKYNKYSSMKIDDELKAKFKEIEIKKDMTSIKGVRFKNARFRGFVGRVVYHIPEDEELRQVVEVLADFAEYGGVGYKTTMGLGLTSRVN